MKSLAATFDIPSLWPALLGAVRNLGREGTAAMAISAIDNDTRA
jgi:L-alanine-DL-glutamate epimerase-like enolase superfamily enzyme